MEIHIAIANNKGGASKSMTAVNLAQAFADLDKKVILIDGDQSGACKNWAMRSQKEGKFRVLSIREAFRYGEEKDIVIYDTAGGISSDEMKDLAKTCDYAVVPCKSDMVNVDATKMTADFFTKNNIQFRVLASDIPHYGDYLRGRDLIAYLEELKIPHFKQIIPRSMKMVDAFNQGLPAYKITGASLIGYKFDEIATQILSDLKSPQKKNNKNNEVEKLQITEEDLELFELDLEELDTVTK